MEAMGKAAELVDYMAEAAAERRAHPEDDLISVIVNTEVEEGRTLDPVVAVSRAVLLLAAGNDTTTNLLGNGASILLDRPDVKIRLVDDPTLIPAAVEEMLRYDPPFHFDYRKAVRDHTLGGREVKAGTPIYHCLAAANRDPRSFPSPLTFDIERKNKRHLAF
jgi:hypothetical protein